MFPLSATHKALVICALPLSVFLQACYNTAKSTPTPGPTPKPTPKPAPKPTLGLTPMPTADGASGGVVKRAFGQKMDPTIV